MSSLLIESFVLWSRYIDSKQLETNHFPLEASFLWAAILGTVHIQDIKVSRKLDFLQWIIWISRTSLERLHELQIQKNPCVLDGDPMRLWFIPTT